MWLIIRFFGLLLVWNTWLKHKWKRYQSAASEKRKVNNRDLFVYFKKRYIRDSKTYLGVPLKRSSQFKIHPETSTDRMFKAWGMATELQVGDKEFDRKVYLESDAKALAQELAESDRAREIIVEIFKETGLQITADTDWLEIELMGLRADTKKLEELLVELADWFDNVPSKTYALFKDPMYFKALTAEFVLTGIAFYGIFSLFQEIWFGHLIDTNIIFSKSIKLTAVLFLILIPFNFWFLKGSSRGHKLILENFFYILFGVPLAAFFLISDANQAWDKGEITNYSLPIIERHRNRHTNYNRPLSSYRRYNYTYTVVADMRQLDLNYPKTFRVNEETYNQNPTNVNVEVGQGHYNQRYIIKHEVE
jgi:hypothetical protein